jgi:hypothetical protein
MPARHIFDSSSLKVLRNYYPAQFPTFWGRFHQAIADGRIVSAREVYNELQYVVKGTWIWDWAQSRKEIFPMPTDDETQFVGEIFKVQHFQTLVGLQQQLKGRPVADPFVIASAKCCKDACVVTEEVLKPNAAKIPNVCEHFDIQCTNVEGFLKQNGWEF